MSVGVFILACVGILAILVIVLFALKSGAKDKNVSTTAMYKQAVLGNYSEDNLPKEIFLLIGGLIMFAVDGLSGFEVSGQDGGAIIWRIFYSLCILVSGYLLVKRFSNRTSKPNITDEQPIATDTNLPVSGQEESVNRADA